MMLRTKIAQRLKAAMSDNSALGTQSKLEKKSGVAQATIGRIIRMETDTRIDTLYSLAAAFGKPLSYFIDENQLGDNVKGAGPQSATRKVPVISWVQAGNWIEAADPYALGDGEDWEDAPVTTGKNAFWLRVIGDSMTAPAGQSIPEGSLVLVDPTVQPDNGRLVVAKLTESNEVTFKKLIIDGGKKYLKPLNPSYPMLEIKEECQVVGVVIEAMQKF